MRGGGSLGGGNNDEDRREWTGGEVSSQPEV